jgi:hypothetical protein
MPRFPRWWFWAAVLVPAVITAIGLTIQASGIERSIAANVHTVLPDVAVVVHGRDVTIGGIQAERLPAARLVAEQAAGVREASTKDPELGPMRLLFHGGEITVTGVTSSQAWRDGFLMAIGAQAHGRTIVDETKTVAGTDFPITTQAAELVVALISQQPEDMTVSIEPGRVSVAGVVRDNVKRTRIVAALRRIFGAGTLVDKTKTKE